MSASPLVRQGLAALVAQDFVEWGLKSLMVLVGWPRYIFLPLKLHRTAVHPLDVLFHANSMLVRPIHPVSLGLFVIADKVRWIGLWLELVASFHQDIPFCTPCMDVTQVLMRWLNSINISHDKKWYIKNIFCYRYATVLWMVKASFPSSALLFVPTKVVTLASVLHMTKCSDMWQVNVTSIDWQHPSPSAQSSPTVEKHD